MYLITTKRKKNRKLQWTITNAKTFKEAISMFLGENYWIKEKHIIKIKKIKQ